MSEYKKHKKLALSICLAILLTSLWSASGAFDSGDAFHRARVAHQLVTEGRLVVESVGSAENGSTFRDQNGAYYSKFGPGQSIFFLPFDALASIVTQKLTVGPALRERIHTFLLSVTVFWLCLSINFWLCLKLLANLGINRLNAYLISFVATFGSSLWQMAKQGQEEIQLSILLLYSLYKFWCWKRTGNNKYVWLSAVSAAATLVFRPTALPIPLGVAGIYVYELFKKNTRSKFFSYLGVALPFVIANFCALAIVGGYNLFKTGNALKSGYSAGESFSGNWFNGIVEPIFGLDKGILWTNPWLLPCLICTFLTWKYLKHDFKILLILNLFLFTSSIAIYCKWFSWAGDHTYGARFQVHLVPLLCLTLGAATITYIRTYFPKMLYTMQYKLLSLSIGFVLFMLQIPSVALIQNLEIYQAVRSNAVSKSHNGSPTGALGQIRLRYANFFSKLITGTPVEFEARNPSAVATQDWEGAARWNFWPWLAEKLLSQNVTILLKALWTLIVLASIICWVYAFRMLVYSN